MAAQIIDGFSIAQNVRAGVGEKVKELQAQGVIPCLAVVLVGENPASISYVTGKEKALAEAGMKSLDIRLPEQTTEEELLQRIDTLNKDSSVHGILVQLPLPQHESLWEFYLPVGNTMPRLQSVIREQKIYPITQNRLIFW